MTRSKLYVILASACLAGYGWVLVVLREQHVNHSPPQVCIIKWVTGLPCPSCGSTRAVLALVHGGIYDAFIINPLGILVAAILVSAPPWILFDLVSGKSTLLSVFRKTEQFIKRPPVALLLFVLVICNWIWNILKAL